MLELVAVLVPRQSERIDKVLVKERHAAEYRASIDAVVAERLDLGQRPASQFCLERHRARLRVEIELSRDIERRDVRVSQRQAVEFRLE